MRMKFEVVVLVLFVLLLGTVVIAWTGIAAPFVLTSTRYAPGYSEKKFQQIKLGDSEAEVRAKLGAPLSKPRMRNGVVIYKYSAQGNFAPYWKTRMLSVSNGIVIYKLSITDN